MYPLQTSQPWARQQWYVAGFSHEFGHTPFDRTILGQRVLFFRAEQGQPVALGGLCPHRFMPLSSGKRMGDTIECAYHGMTFDGTGACVRGPAGMQAAGPSRLRRYPLVERGPLVWIWTGDAQPWDLPSVPDGSRCGLEDNGWRADPNGVMHFDARYMLIVDNLFDLSHISWVHESLIGKMALCTRPASFHEDDELLSYARSETAAIDPFTRLLFPESVGPIESRLATLMISPGLISAVGPSIGEAEGSPLAGKHWGDVHFVHAITPETERSTNVFTVVTRDFRLDDDELTEMLCTQNRAILAQDKAVAETIERGLALADTAGERSFLSDRGGIAARRRIESAIKRENATVKTSGGE